MGTIMHIEHELVTPVRAAELLALNFDGQRHIRRTVVDRYAEDMSHGDWHETGDTIKIDDTGRLLDGQHRLRAVVASGTSLWFWVAYDMSADSYDVLDQGLKRGLCDVLAARGVLNQTTVSAAVGACAAFTTRGTFRSSGRNGSVTQLVKLWEANREIERFTKTANRIYTALRFSPGPMMSMLYIFSITKTEDVERFASDIATGDGIHLGEPAFAVRKVLLERMATPGGKRYDVDHYTATIVRGWNSFAKGEAITMVKGRINGKYPEIFDPHGLLDDWISMTKPQVRP